MTFAVKTNSSVTVEGEVPGTMQAVYSNTYNKGQVRAGDVATLSLTSMGGITIEDVRLTMRANAKSGAGNVIVTADGEQIGATSVSYTDVSEPVVAWTGVMPDVKALTVQIGGTQNSLYIDTFTVSWVPAAARTVTLMHGGTVFAELTESAGGSGIVLPAMEVDEADQDGWRFVGWSKEEFWQTEVAPDYLLASTRYYPAAANEVLWALYKSEEMTGEKPYATELVSGTYMYVNRTTHTALSGVPEDGIISYANADAYDDNQHYQIEFKGTDTAYITHIPTNTPIGYEGTQMAVKASPWRVYHEGDQTLFWATINGKNYVLWLNISSKEDSGIVYAGLLQADPGPSPMGLQDTYMPTELLVFTCHPEFGVGIEEVKDEGISGLEDEWKVVFGIYEIYIRNGKKYLILR